MLALSKPIHAIPVCSVKGDMLDMAEMDSTAKGARRKWTRGERWLLAGIVAILGIGIAAIRIVGEPPLVIPVTKAPSPNGYDLFVQASRLTPVQWNGSSKATTSGNPASLTAPYDPVEAAAVKDAPLINAAGLALLRQGLREQCLAPQNRDPTGTFPELATLRALARGVRATAVAYAGKGQDARAVQTALDGMAMGENITNGGTLIDGLVGIACCAIDRAAIWPIVDRLDARTARAAAQRLAAIDAHSDPLSDILTHEKWSGEAAFQNMFSHPLAGTMLQITSLHTTRGIIDAYGQKMDARAEMAKKPFRRNADAPPSGISFVDKTMDLPLPGIAFKWCSNSASNRLLATTLALRAYKLDHGTYPATLQALVPQYLPAVPADPFAAAPLRYHLQGNRYILYSVGPDGKDDGGKPGINTRYGKTSYAMTKDIDGDFVAGLNP